MLRLIPFILAVLLWIILISREHFFLRKVEDLSLFLFDSQFISDSFRTPGGFLGLAGSFLTQFLHLPWLGALIWVLALSAAYLLTIRTLRLPDSYSVLALIPVALLIIGNMSIGYGIFIIREQDHFFAPLLGYMAALVPTASLRHIKALWSRILFLVLWTVIGYPLLGTFAFAGTLTAALSSVTGQELPRNQRIAVLLSALAIILAVPLFIYSTYTSYRLADSWTVGLPSVSYDEWARSLRAPFQLALLCQIILAAVSKPLASKTLKGSGRLILESVICIASIVSVWVFWYGDDNFTAELAMSEAVDRSDWNRTIEIFQETVRSHSDSDAKAYESRTKKIKEAQSDNEIADIVDRYSDRFYEPTRTMVMYRDLALLKTYRALDEAFSMKDGGRMQKSRSQIPMALQSGKQFYMQYGLVNMCYRWCMEDLVENGWSYSTLRYMTMHAITMQDSNLAAKYLDKLDKTIFYRKWADSQRPLASDQAAMASTEPYRSILPYRCFEDQMTNDRVRTELYLISHFVGKRPSSATPEYDRAALLFAMRTQNISSFWEKLLYYVDSNEFKELPRSVQEAAVLYSNLERNNLRLPYNDRIKESYDSFNQFVQSHPIRSMKESDYTYYRKFGKTFYYFYYFTRDLQTY